MSKARSPRAVRSMTMGTSGMHRRLAGGAGQAGVSVPRRGRSRLLVRSIIGVFALAFVVFAAAAGRPGSSPAAHVDAAAAATPKPAVQRGMPVAPVVVPAVVRPKRLTALIRATKARSWLSTWPASSV